MFVRVEEGLIEVDDDSFVKAFREINIKLQGGGVVSKGKPLELVTTGKNDKSALIGIFTSLGKPLTVDPNKRMRYDDLLKVVADAAQNNPSSLIPKGEVDLTMRVVKNVLTVGPSSKPQLKFSLFKSVDRYTSFIVSELEGSGPDIGFQMSFWASLLALMGLYSAYIGRLRDAYLFLFLEPNQVSEILNAGYKGLDVGRLATAVLTAREVGINELKGTLPISVIPHALLARVMLDLKIRDAIKTTNLRRLYLKLVRLHVEGNTYKVYDEVPIAVTAAEDAESRELISKLSHQLSSKSPLVQCLSRFVWKGMGMKGVNLCEETDHLVRAVEYLYRFIALSDWEAIYHYVKELEEAARLLESQGGPSSVRGKIYRSWAGSLA